MVLLPGDTAPSGGQAVEVDIQRFIEDASGRVLLDANWTLLGGSTPVLMRSETVAVGGNPAAADIAPAMTEALGKLADRISRVLDACNGSGNIGTEGAATRDASVFR